MSSNSIFIFAVIGLSALVLSVLVFITSKVKPKSEKKSKSLIYTYLEIASSKDTSPQKLQEAINAVVSSCPFPEKEGIKVPPNAKPYLDFIFLAVCNKHSNAKMIAKMNQDLKRANPDYRDEIDIYENKAIESRINSRF